MNKVDRLFDESTWTIIEELLPNDETVRRVALDDFMWFIGRSKKYKNNFQKAEDYIRHLKLKANANVASLANKTIVFKSIDIDRIESQLIG